MVAIVRFQFPVRQQVSCVELFKQNLNSLCFWTSGEETPVGSFHFMKFFIWRWSAGRGEIIGAEKVLSFRYILPTKPYQPRPNALVNEGRGSQKRSVHHSCAFGSPVPQHKECNLPHDWPTAFTAHQESHIHNILDQNLAWPMSRFSSWLRRITCMYLCQEQQKGCVCALWAIKVNLVLCLWGTHHLQKTLCREIPQLPQAVSPYTRLL